MIKAAVEAAKEGISLVAWTVPGKEKLARQHRAELIDAAFQRQILSLHPKD